ncbi:MAG: ATP-binding protein [Clostridiales bacterium]|nr:ATP-binding protein [Clostridiales bacterium]
MLKRKIYKQIVDFYNNNPEKALMITGARQVGKSYIIEEYAKKNFKSYIRIDFIKNPDYVEILKDAGSAENILLRLSSVFGDKLIPNNTMIFFDEVQECKELITQIKYLVQEGSYKYVLSGSLLGTIFQDIHSVPVGYMSIIRMYPLDFEEFAWANGIGEKVFEVLSDAYQNKMPIDEYIHKRLLSLFELYLVVGGMPSSITQYLKTKNLKIVAEEQLSIVDLYKQDIAKYDKEEKLYLREIFDLIPSELHSKNKRFILKNLNEYTKFSKYHNSFIWLSNAGVALPSYVASEPKSPLVMSRSTNLFKLYLNDVGLLTAMYGNDIQLKILNHETEINFGALYENVAAEELTAHGFRLFFFNNKKLGEVDFLVESEGKIIPLEIKSGKNYSRHNAINNLLKIKEFDIDKGYVFCNSNVKKEDKITYYPIYMLMFLKKNIVPKDMVFESDFRDINNIVS